MTQTQGDGRYIVLTGGATTQLDESLGAGPYTITIDEEADEASNQILTFGAQTVAASAWTSDSTNTGYSYRASVPLSGVTADYTPIVAFSAADATSGNLAPVSGSYAGGVYIYAKEIPTETVNILSVVCLKGA